MVESKPDQPATRKWSLLFPAVVLITAIFLSSSTVVTPKRFVRSVARYSPIAVTESSFGRFWESWWWLFVKGWHATEFGLVFLALRRMIHPHLAAVAAIILAATDEIHQLWVPKRGAHMSDWLIDVLGVGITWWLVEAGSGKSLTRVIRLVGNIGGGILALLALRQLAMNPF